MQVDGVGFKIFARLIYDGELAAGAVAGVDAQDFFAAQGRLQEQVAQVGGEDVDGVFFGLARQFHTHLALHGRGKQAFVAVFHRILKLLREGRAWPDGIVPRDIGPGLFVGQSDAEAQDIFALGPVQRENAVRHHFCHALTEFVIQLVSPDRLGACAPRFRYLFTLQNNGWREKLDRGILDHALSKDE